MVSFSSLSRNAETSPWMAVVNLNSYALETTTLSEFGTDVQRYPRFLIFPQLGNVVLEYTCDESATLRCR